MKFGKREKIVVGSILGLLVIGALDLLVFRKSPLNRTSRWWRNAKDSERP
jgi:hypothetical protein